MDPLGIWCGASFRLTHSTTRSLCHTVPDETQHRGGGSVRARSYLLHLRLRFGTPVLETKRVSLMAWRFAGGL